MMDNLHFTDFKPSRIDQPKSCDINAIATANEFFANLLAGNILPRSKKIITSTPNKLFQLPKALQPKILCAVQGINESSVKLICDKISTDRIHFDKIFHYLDCHPKLKSYCYNPTICTMVMNFIKMMPNISRPVALQIKTLTDIFIFFLKAYKCLDVNIKMLSDTVFEDFCNKQIYFQDYNQLFDFQIMIRSLFRLESIFKYERDFLNFMWQDFFVSVKLRLYVSKDECKDRLCDLASEKYKMVTKFLFGLCNEQSLNKLLSFVEESGLNSAIDRKEVKTMLKQFAIRNLQQVHHSDLDEDTNTKIFKHCTYFGSILSVLGWLREMNDDNFTKQAAESLSNEIFVCKTQILPSDIPNIIDVFQGRCSSLAVRIIFPNFFEDCFRYFFKELHTTLHQNPNILVRKLEGKNDSLKANVRGKSLIGL